MTRICAVCLGFVFTAFPVLAQEGKTQETKKQEGAKAIVGYWGGKLDVAGTSLRLHIHIKDKGEGSLTATLDSPDQGALGLAISEVTFKDGELVLALKNLGARFEGKMNEDGSAIAGKWKQGGAALPVTFQKLDKAPVYARPQDPKKPYPYREEEITYENKAAKVKLAGTLTLPKGEGPFAAVLLITGSGPQDRDETIFGHKPFLVLADYLTRKGLAVLRVDDRGIGKSTGKFAGATTEDFAGDVLAGVEFLKTHKEIDARRIGLVGHSEGGIIAPMVAVKSKDVAFIVLLAGTGLPGEDISAAQIVLILKAAGKSEKFIAWNMNVQKRVVAILKEQADVEAADKLIKEVLTEEIANLDEKDQKQLAQIKAMLGAQLKKETFAWSRFFLAHDPRPVLRKVEVPVLAICGDKDVQVPAKENLAEIEKALKEGGHKDFTIKAFPGRNHLFQTCKTGAIAEYGSIEETMSPEVLEFVAEWITNRAK